MKERSLRKRGSRGLEVVNCHSERSEESCFPSLLSAILAGKILRCPQDDKMKADRFSKEARDDDRE